MGLVLAIFGFIIGIPMLLGGLGLIAMGSDRTSHAWDYAKEDHKEWWKNFEFGDDHMEVRDFKVQQENTGTGMMVGGGILALFAFLIMWGGNRTRRPKEVRIKRD